MPTIINGVMSDAVPNPTSQSWRRDINLKDEIQKGMREMEMYCQLPVQYTAIRRCMERWHIMAQTRTDTDQLPIVVITVLQHLTINPTWSKVIITCQSEAMVKVVERAILNVGRYTGVICFDCSAKGIPATTVAKSQVLLGTPSQVIAKLRNGAIRPSHVTLFVMYQTDEQILQKLTSSTVALHKMISTSVQTLFTTTNSSMDTMRLMEELQLSPIIIDEETFPPPVSSIKQSYVTVEEERWKFDTLQDLLEELQAKAAVVVCGSQASAQTVHSKWESTTLSSTMPAALVSTVEKTVVDSSASVFITRALIDDNPFPVPKLLIMYDYPRGAFYDHVVNTFGYSRVDGIVITFVAPAEGAELAERLQKLSYLRIDELPGDIRSILA